MQELDVSNDGCASFGGVGIVFSLDTLAIHDNTILTSLDGLENVRTAATSLSIFRNNNLVDINGLSGLQTVGSFDVQDNPDLVSLPLFDSLNNLVALQMSTLPALEDAGSFPGVTDIGAISISALGASVGPTFPALVHMTGDFNLTNNANLTDLSFVSALQVIDGNVAWFNNASLASVSLPSISRIFGTLDVENNLICPRASWTTSARNPRRRSW